MATIGFDKVNTVLLQLGKKYAAETPAECTVGYEAEYALAVHEDVEMKLKGIPRPSGIGVYWGPHGQAKFLEQPARVNAKEYARLVKDVLKSGGTMQQALGVAGSQLLRDSQELCPVEWGNLKASGFVEQKG
jgi:hypothetical protein